MFRLASCLFSLVLAATLWAQSTVSDLVADCERAIVRRYDTPRARLVAEQELDAIIKRDLPEAEKRQALEAFINKHIPPSAVAEIWRRAEQGNAQAQNSLGTYYEVGRGVAQDDRQAAAWYRKAAEQGHADAQYYLGNMYEGGRGV